MANQKKTITELRREIPVRAEVDVLVVGGGPAGIMAARAAAGKGLRVMLIESRGYLGGNLTQNRIERLEAIGMVWSTSNDLWEQNYAAATQYYLEHGDLEVPIKYETPSGFGLGVWLGAQRAAHKAGELPQEQVERLDALFEPVFARRCRKSCGRRCITGTTLQKSTAPSWKKICSGWTVS